MKPNHARARAGSSTRDTRRSECPSQSADGQTDGDLLKELAKQVNEALREIVRRVEALESQRSGSGTGPSVVIHVGSGSSVTVDPQDDDRMGFKAK